MRLYNMCCAYLKGMEQSIDYCLVGARTEEEAIGVYMKNNRPRYEGHTIAKGPHASDCTDFVMNEWLPLTKQPSTPTDVTPA